MSSINEKCTSEEASNVNKSSSTVEDLYRIFNDNDDISTASTTIYNYFAEQFPERGWTLMNYGFISKDTDVKKIEIKNANHGTTACYLTQLYAAVIDDIILQDLDVLEVGCGRGGGCAWIASTLEPKSMLGVDYSESGIKLCQKIHSDISNLRFEHGNAEQLPCSNDSFDVVINVESSHCYTSMERFLSEVYRVLKPGGYFLWADLRESGTENVVVEQFKKSGLEMIEQVDITENVILSLAKSRDGKLDFIKQFPKDLQTKFEPFFDNPLLKNGHAFYWRCKCRKSLKPSL
ncbi:unnamed protein product [Adineta steineri]|uniref:Methyltransferase domain-containing protein n=1 Tax=Adineta steineri TaxID=433720 RepID=A0A819XRP6_9BILA|nr:unnamed protein product [Adineta steineri]CAF4143671.1 unnamed protein product [Adineta steineri]